MTKDKGRGRDADSLCGSGVQDPAPGRRGLCRCSGHAPHLPASSTRQDIRSSSLISAVGAPDAVVTPLLVSRNRDAGRVSSSLLSHTARPPPSLPCGQV